MAGNRLFPLLICNRMVSIHVFFISQFVNHNFFRYSARIWTSDRYGRVNIFSFSRKETFLYIYCTKRFMIPVADFSYSVILLDEYCTQMFKSRRQTYTARKHGGVIRRTWLFNTSCFAPAWAATIPVLSVTR